MFSKIVGIGESLHHKYRSIASTEQKLLKLEEEERNPIPKDEIAKIRHAFNAAKEKFLKVPDELKEMPKMNPKGLKSFIFVLYVETNFLSL